MPDSNLNEVIGFLDAFSRSITFTRKGVEASLGKDVAMTIIRGSDASSQGGIVGRCAAGVTPEGQPWPENSAAYAADKEEKYGISEVNRRTNQMLSQESLLGRTTIEPEVVALIYGTGNPPSDSRAPTGYLSKQDSETPDTLKAAIAHSTGRGFYGIGAGDPEAVSAVCQEVVNRLISEANGG